MLTVISRYSLDLHHDVLPWEPDAQKEVCTVVQFLLTVNLDSKSMLGLSLVTAESQ